MFREKLHKKLYAALVENKFESPTPFQLKCLPKVNSGADVIGVAPEGSGKSTLIVVASILKTQRAMEDTPRVLILSGNSEKGREMEEQFRLFAKDTDLRINTAFEDDDKDDQNAAIYDGTDILIGTAKRVLELYFINCITLSKLKLFVMDDPEMTIKHSWQGHVDRLAMSFPKCQHVVFTNDFTDKVESLIHKFMIAPQLVELDE
jgi:ATP-dependent RNA helicase RhlE